MGSPSSKPSVSLSSKIDLAEAMTRVDNAIAKNQDSLTELKAEIKQSLQHATPDQINAISEILRGEPGKRATSNDIYAANKLLQDLQVGLEVPEENFRYNDSARKAAAKMESAAKAAASMAKVRDWQGIEEMPEEFVTNFDGEVEVRPYEGFSFKGDGNEYQSIGHKSVDSSSPRTVKKSLSSVLESITKHLIPSEAYAKEDGDENRFDEEMPDEQSDGGETVIGHSDGGEGGGVGEDEGHEENDESMDDEDYENDDKKEDDNSIPVFGFNI